MFGIWVEVVFIIKVELMMLPNSSALSSKVSPEGPSYYVYRNKYLKYTNEPDLDSASQVHLCQTASYLQQ